MKYILLMAVILPLLSGCGIVRTAANVTKTIVTIPVKVLSYTEVEESDVDYLAVSENARLH